MTLFEHTIRGDPVPKGRPRVDPNRPYAPYTPPRTRAAERAVKQEVYLLLRKPLDGPLSVTLRFQCKTARRTDIDNLAKLVLDALNKIAWHDDGQIEELHVTVDRQRPPGQTYIHIEQRKNVTLF